MLDKCLLDKVAAIKELNSIIPKYQKNIENIEYEVYQFTFTYNGRETIGYEEFLVVRYKGGAYSAICCDGNSFYAIMKELVEVLEHGNYDHERYERVKERATKVEVE